MPKLLLKCPNCGNTMLYQSGSFVLAGRRKRCVYCGKSFKAASHMVKTA